MSLQYSSWDSDGNNKKRTSSYGKPLPKAAASASASASSAVASSAATQESNLLDSNDLEIVHNYPLSPEQTMQQAEMKQKSIHELLDKMNQEGFDNIGEGLSIEPLAPPQIIQKNGQGGVGKDNLEPVGNDLVNALANYRTIYSDKLPSYKQPSYGKENMTVGTDLVNQDVLLQKLNYMIYLLEQQQNEKTDNLLEEFVLYCFLGIFIIYIVDGFTRSGGSHMTRYAR